MNDLDRLLALTSAAESCNGAAREFIEQYGDEPQFSRSTLAEGRPYIQPAANQQAEQHLAGAEAAAARLEGHVAA